MLFLLLEVVSGIGRCGGVEVFTRFGVDVCGCMEEAGVEVP